MTGELNGISRRGFLPGDCGVGTERAFSNTLGDTASTARNRLSNDDPRHGTHDFP